MEGKESNPKDSLGIRKIPLSTIPAPVMHELGLAMLEGALKYGRHNYRAVGVRASVYYDALQRHITAWWEGEDIDPESGLSHIAKAMACLAVLRDSMIQGNWVDDRPPVTPEIGKWMAELNEKAAALLEKYPDPVPAYTKDSVCLLQSSSGTPSSDSPPCAGSSSKQKTKTQETQTTSASASSRGCCGRLAGRSY